MVSAEFNSLNFFRNKESPDYVFHPLNAFQLLKRTYSISKFMEHLSKIMPELKSVSLNTEFLYKDLTRAYHGLADLHEYVNLDTYDLSKGIIRDLSKNTFYKAKSKLSINDLLQTAIEARLVGYYEGNVNWLEAALTKAKQENKPKKMITDIK